MLYQVKMSIKFNYKANIIIAYHLKYDQQINKESAQQIVTQKH